MRATQHCQLEHQSYSIRPIKFSTSTPAVYFKNNIVNILYGLNKISIKITLNMTAVQRHEKPRYPFPCLYLH